MHAFIGILIYFLLVHTLSSIPSELIASDPRTSIIAPSSFHTEHSNRTCLFHGCNCNCIVQLATFTVMVGVKGPSINYVSSLGRGEGGRPKDDLLNRPYL